MASGSIRRLVPYDQFVVSSHIIYSDQTIASKDSISNPTNGLTITKSGYYPLGIVGWSASGSYSGFISPGRLYTSNEREGACEVFWNFQNNRDSDLTSQGCSVRILWLKV